MTRALILLALVACNPRGPAVPDGYVASPDDPITPTGTWNGPSFSELLEVETWGTRLAFCSGVQGFQLWEAEDPAAMTKLDDIGFTAGSSSYPRCQRVAVDAAESVVWVTNHGDQIQPQPFLAAIDASNPQVLSQIVSLELPESLEGLDVDATHLYVTAHDDGLLIFTKTGVPAEVARLPLANAWNVVRDGEYAYVANGQHGLAVVDVSSPASPTLAAELDLSGVAKDLQVTGSRLYVATGGAGVAVLDISDPTQPVLVEEVLTPGSALALAHDPSTNGLFVADWTRIRAYSTANPDALELIGTEPLVAQDSRTLGIAARDGFIFSSNWTQMASYTFHPDRRAPDLRLNPPSIDFPTAAAGESSTAALTLANDGSQDLSFGELALPADVQASPLPDALAPGEQRSITLTWTSSSDSPWDGVIQIESGDVDQPVQTVLAEANQPGLGVGDTAPDFAFTDLNGTSFSTASAGGEVTLLAYFATF